MCVCVTTAGVITPVHLIQVCSRPHTTSSTPPIKHPHLFPGQFFFPGLLMKILESWLSHTYLDLHLPVRVPDPDHSDVSRGHEEAGLLLPVHHHTCPCNTSTVRHAHLCEEQLHTHTHTHESITDSSAGTSRDTHTASASPPVTTSAEPSRRTTATLNTRY